MIKKIFYLCLSLICIILGVIGLILPIMPGFIFFIIAIILLSKTSNRLHIYLHRLRDKYDWLDKAWIKIENKRKK